MSEPTTKSWEPSKGMRDYHDRADAVTLVAAKIDAKAVELAELDARTATLVREVSGLFRERQDLVKGDLLTLFRTEVGRHAALRECESDLPTDCNPRLKIRRFRKLYRRFFVGNAGRPADHH